MEITTWAREYFQKTLLVNTIHPFHSPLPAKTLKVKKEAISKHDPEAQAFSLGQGSFKMDCGKVENCSVVRRIKI